MSKLLNKSLRKLILYAGLVLVVSIPVYYLIISRLWQYELDEHNITLTPEAGREDKLLIVGAVTLLTVLFFILLLTVFIWVNRRISRQLWQPFYKSLEQIKNFDLDQNISVVFDKTDIAEFAELNKSLDKLLAGNIAAYHQQKEFADNASHELQTPLAIVQSKLEVLLQGQTLTQEQYTNIEEALNALSRVSRINKNLLLLTRIENSQFMEKETIVLPELLADMLPQFATIADGKQITLSPVIQQGVQITGNRALVEILLNNLILNAIRHSPAGSDVLVNLSAKTLIITNPGSQSLQQEQLFKRFAIASSQTPGTGLGLALVKQICNRYEWNIHYSFQDGLHVFNLHF